MNNTAGATQHSMPATAALNEYFKPHLMRLGSFFSDIFLIF
jgi:hypothetical protein